MLGYCQRCYKRGKKMKLREIDESKQKEELSKLVYDALNEHENVLLEKQKNKELIEKLIETAMNNPLYQKVEIVMVVNSIKEKFAKTAQSGDVVNFIYVGGNDIFEKRLEQDRSQQALFIAVDENGELQEDIFRENRVWGRYPGFKENGEFSPGNKYSIEIQDKEVVGTDGITRTYHNMKNYSLIEPAEELTVKTILDIKEELGDMIEEDVEGEFSETIVLLLNEKIRWSTVPFDFEVVSVKPVKKTIRTRDGDVYKFVTPTEGELKGETPFVPVDYVSDTNVSNIVMSLTGKASLNGNREITYFINMYPQRMGQYFVNSPTIMEAVNSEDFHTSTPEMQADYLKLLLSGKEFRAVGSIRRIDMGNDSSKLLFGMSAIALIELRDD